MTSGGEHLGGKQAALFMHEILSSLIAGAAVLDLGCGNGSFPYANFPHLSIRALDRTRPEALNEFPHNVQFCLSSAEELPYGDSTFDVVIANFVFEHVADFASVIREVDRVLKEGGHLYMSVPNSKSFEDDLYRRLYNGGGHLQRFTFESILHLVYSTTRLKLISYADWPAGFTFLQNKEAIRHFILSVAESVRQASGLDLRSRCNYIMLFRREGALGFRQVTRVCNYCGAGDGIDEHAEPRDVAWRCQVCGRTNSWRRVRLEDMGRLEADARHFLKGHPPLEQAQPEGAVGDGGPQINPYDLEELRLLAHLSRTLRNSRLFPLARKLLKKML